MSLNIMLSNLQKINAGKIVLVKIGAFYIAKENNIKPIDEN